MFGPNERTSDTYLYESSQSLHYIIAYEWRAATNPMVRYFLEKLAFCDDRKYKVIISWENRSNKETCLNTGAYKHVIDNNFFSRKSRREK